MAAGSVARAGRTEAAATARRTEAAATATRREAAATARVVVATEGAVKAGAAMGAAG